MIKAFFAAAMVALVSLGTDAQAATAATAANPISQPAFNAGDSWVFDEAHQKGNSGFSQSRTDVIIDRVDDDTMTVGGKIDGAPTNYTDSIVGLDWSKRVTIDGKQVVTTRPLSFPLTVGSTWSSDYDLPPAGNQKNTHFHGTYKVVGWEDVTVPAGTFHALKVEEHGTGDAVVQIPAIAVSAAASTGPGANGLTHVQRASTRILHVTTYSEVYYVPDIKYWVKNVQEGAVENGQ